jgi:hypothetical protein
VLGKFTFSNIDYASVKGIPNANSTTSYILLEGLMPGKNYLWNLDLTEDFPTALKSIFNMKVVNQVHPGLCMWGEQRLERFFNRDKGGKGGKGTKAQRHRGTKAQRHKAQRHRGTKAQRPEGQSQ